MIVDYVQLQRIPAHIIKRKVTIKPTGNKLPGALLENTKQAVSKFSFRYLQSAYGWRSLAYDRSHFALARLTIKETIPDSIVAAPVHYTEVVYYHTV
ncbi:hypothetical protein D3C80_1045830 [compost metagenome]